MYKCSIKQSSIHFKLLSNCWSLKAFSLQLTQTLTRFNGFLSPTLSPNYSPTNYPANYPTFLPLFPINFTIITTNKLPTNAPTITETKIESDENDSNNSEIYLEGIVKHQLYC